MGKEELYKYLAENLSLDYDSKKNKIYLYLGDDIISSISIQ